MNNARNKSDLNPLPRFVGYAEVFDALGVSKSTLERMVRDECFPKPVQLAPNRVGWQVEVVTAWLADRSKGLVAHAVAHPEDLEPEQLEDQALDLALQALSKRTGKPVDPNGHYLQLAERVTLGEFYARQIHEFETMSECFGDIGLERAMYLAGWLFAPLRAVFARMLPGGPEAQVFRNPDRLSALGAAALYDDTWNQLEDND